MLTGCGGSVWGGRCEQAVGVVYIWRILVDRARAVQLYIDTHGMKE